MKSKFLLNDWFARNLGPQRSVCDLDRAHLDGFGLPGFVLKKQELTGRDLTNILADLRRS